MRLLIHNLHDARKLGMIDCNDTDFSDYLTIINSNWDHTADQNREYDNWMKKTKQKFDQQFRPVQAFRGKAIPFCNVLRMTPFVRYWLDTLEPGLGDLEAGKAKDQITKLERNSAPISSTELAHLQESFLRLNLWIKNSGSSRNKGVHISIGQLLDPATRPFWIGGRVNKPETSAQYWRDRLGLIHVSAGSKSCGDLLVRMRFVATMANDKLPRLEHLQHWKQNPKLLWAFRPSVLHGGNRRFVQSIAADRMGRVARRGSTRDISSIQYLEGERELLLLAGEIANARLVGLDLLHGFADINSKIDNDDSTFVESIARQRSWPKK